jgi:tetratricopeptide (TPR) repeat protein
LLLQADNQPSPALDAYMAAARLDSGDRSVALAIVSLSSSTGRQDAFTLAARGRALMTLGRASEALEPLTQALRLAPDLAEAKAQLRLAKASAAERSGASNTKTAVLAPRPGAAAASTVAANSGVIAGRRYSNDAPVTRSN